jgi:hypothetical protein
MRGAAVLVLLLALGTGFACDAASPAGPTALDVTGTWTGSSTYPNAPFELELVQTGNTLRGEYRDELDRSIGMIGTYTRPDFAIVVDFGDAKLNLEGTVRNARYAQGTMFTSALGNQPFPFVMTR